MDVGTVMLDYSTLPAWALIEATRNCMDRYQSQEGTIPIVAIGHNKNFTARSAENLQEYLSWCDSVPELTCSSYRAWYETLPSKDNTQA